MTHLERLEKWAYRLGLILTLVSAARFGWSLTQLASHRIEAADSRNVPHPAGPGGVTLPGGFPGLPTTAAISGMPTPEAVKAAIAQAVGSSATVPSAIDKSIKPQHDIVHSFLSVQAGPPRSELRINGTLVGNTPFLGQISCERGQTVKVDILPPKGLPSHYTIPCLEGEMRLRDEP